MAWSARVALTRNGSAGGELTDRAGRAGPESMRSNGVQPWSRQVTVDELPAAIEEFVMAEALQEGTSVLVVEPERIVGDGPSGAAELYVALTRATQRLGVLHHEPLPTALGQLAEVNLTT
jgi:hypothetical protein